MVLRISLWFLRKEIKVINVEDNDFLWIFSDNVIFFNEFNRGKMFNIVMINCERVRDYGGEKEREFMVVGDGDVVMVI